MKKLFLLLSSVILVSSLSTAENRAKRIMKELLDPKSNKVLVASHRSDWRNHPENSIPAMKSAIDMGVDIIEIDLQMTKDSVLVICHDRTLDRTTSGKGKVSEWTYDSISQLTLKSGHGCRTQIKMPTFREALAVCKDKVVVNIDKGYEYFDKVLEITDEMGVTDQMIIKGNKPLEKVMNKINGRMVYFPIVDYTKKNAQKLADSYLSSGYVPAAFEVVWPEYTPEVQNTLKKIHDTGAKLWVNALWDTHNGGLCDDAAMYGNPAEIYGKLLETGASLVQSDRPQLLLNYLRSIGRHE